jgi:hypothetical protein
LSQESTNKVDVIRSVDRLILLRLPALQAATPEMAMRPFQGWPPAGYRIVGQGRP